MKYDIENTCTDKAVMESPAAYKSGRDAISCRIVEHIGVLRTNANGWSREFNVVSWNDGKPRFDIRDWSEDHTKMSKGITISGNELKRIFDWISARGTGINEESGAAEESEVKEKAEN